MADEVRMALEELLRKPGLQEPEFLQVVVLLLAQERIELGVSQHPSPGVAHRCRWDLPERGGCDLARRRCLPRLARLGALL
jgi:hypothetical protein